MRRITPALIPLLFAACAGGDADTEAGMPEDTAARAPTGQRIEVAGVGFATPESVLHDPVDDVYLVSNINGSPLDADDNGFISRLSPDGEVLELQWIDGGADDVQLNAPKGMAIRGDTLYVADIDCVRMFARASGAAAGSICFEDATFLNDIAVDANGTLYVTDTGMQAGEDGLEPSGSDAVYRFSPDGRRAPLAEGESLGHPNGIAFGPRGGFVVTFGTGEIYQLGADGSRTPVLPGRPERQLDGIVFTSDGRFAFTSWGDQAVHLVGNDGNVTRVVTDVQAPADLGYDATRNRIMVPLFMDNTVIIQELPAGGG